MKMKLMVMTLVVAMLLSMSAFAASVGYTSLVPTEINDGADYSITVNYSATGYNTGDQITLLVLTGSSEITWSDDAKTIPANVAYIDQEAIEGATGSFTFTVAKSFVAEKEVYVKLGATAQATAAAGTYTFTTSGGDDDVTVTVDSSISDAFGVSGLKLAKIEGADGTKTLTVAGAEVVFVKNGETPYYFVLTTADITAADLVWSDATPTLSHIGDVGGDGLTVSDVGYAVGIIGGTNVLTTDKQRFLADASGDGSITVADVGSTVSILGGGTPGVFAK